MLLTVFDMNVWLIWRVNVWKSSIFNKFFWNFRAIVTDISWTTREIIKEKVSFTDKIDWFLFDSPWLTDFTEELKFIERIIDESDIILFVVDFKSWFTSSDYIIKDLIFNKWKANNTILVVNKMDWKVYHKDHELLLANFFELGFTDVRGVSAKQWDWMAELRDNLLEKTKKLNLKVGNINTKEFDIPLAIVWRPNVWKSTLINRLVGEYISEVHEEAWTTLDYIVWDFTYKKKSIRIFDTVWIRRRWKIKGLEKIAFDKTLSMLWYIKPIVIFVIDIIDWVTHRDMSLLWEIIKMNLPVIVWVNKIDEVDINTKDILLKKITQLLDFAKRIPIIPISAKEWIWLPKLIDFVLSTQNELNKRISTSELNKILNNAWLNTPPRFPKNKICKFYYASQLETNPPKFQVSINKKSNLNFAFKRWFENVIRNNSGFIWVPLIIEFKEWEWAGRYKRSK